jgi:hypothetical protein
MNGSDIEELIYTETEKRLDEMSDSSYRFPERLGAADKAGIVILILVSLILIILCMTGVIK